MKDKNPWRPMSLLVEHDMHVERVSQEWKESQESFEFLHAVTLRTLATIKAFLSNLTVRINRCKSKGVPLKVKSG
jgi:hypothetical protein